MKMVYLFFPKQENNSSLTSTLSSGECLGLGYLASMLRMNGYAVKIVNAECELVKNKDLIDLIIQDKPFLLGISPVATTMADTLSICKKVKDMLPNIHITLGGHHATATAYELLHNEECVDSVIMGEGEYSIIELTDMLTGKTSTISRNISMRINGVVQIGEKCIINDIDIIPYATRDTLEKIIIKRNRREARLVTSRGCISNCSFCTSPSFYNRTWRGHSPTRVVEEIETLVRIYGISHIWINDDAYIIKTKKSQQRAYDIAKGIIEKKLMITYRALLRADSLDGALYILPTLKESGLNTVFIGFESASDHALNIYNKGLNQVKNLEIVSILREHGIKIQVGFIMFNPYSCVEDLKQNAFFLKEIGELFRMFPLTRALDLFPGTSMAKKLAEEGLLLKHYSYKSNLISDYEFNNKYVKFIYHTINKQYDEISQKYDAEINNIFYRYEHKDHDRFRSKLNEIHYSYFLNLLDSVHSKDLTLRINSERLQKVSAILEMLRNVQYVKRS